MRTPLFQVVLAHDRNLEIDLAGLTARYLYLDHIRSNFDFALRIREDSEGLNLLLEYNTRLFEVATIRRLLKAFETMLTGIVASPDQKLMDFPLLSEAERRQLLGDWETREAEEVARKKLQSVRRKLAPVGRPQTK
jgi:non-ribosomal peptide synthetase component F